MHRLITDSAKLEDWCRKLAQEPFITLDTEFIREKTYWPHLCLIQLGGEKDVIAVDPLAEGIDMTPVWNLLRDEKLLKVLHAGRQDMEIFWREMGELPASIFDTQIAAQVCGLGENIGYEALVSKLLGKQVDKSQRFTDWARRPLTQAQVDYALGDVIHLHDAYVKMRKEIEKRGRMHWIEEEMAELGRLSLYVIEPEEAWQRIKFRASKRQQLGRLKAYAAWREKLAQEEDVPRSRVIRDDPLAVLAINPPKDLAAMQKVRGFPQHLKREWRESLWQVVEQVRDIAKEDCPEFVRGKPLPPQAEGRLELLKLLLKHCAREAHVAPRLVADKAALEWLASGNTDPAHPLMHGWRLEVFGQQALELMAGKVSFSLDPKTGEVVLK